MREFNSMSMSIMRVRKRASSYVAPSSSLAEADPTTANESHSSDYRLTQRKQRRPIHKLSPFSLSPFWPYHSVAVLAVAVLACRRYSLSPF